MTPINKPLIGCCETFKKVRSKEYHQSDCPSYKQIAQKNRVPFGSAQEASEAGYKLAGNCPH